MERRCGSTGQLKTVRRWWSSVAITMDTIFRKVHTIPASGMVSVIEAARVLSAYAGDSLKRTVRFIAFGTEEIGLTGAFRYVEAHDSELDNIRFMLNMDAAGGASRKGIVLHQWDALGAVL